MQNNVHDKACYWFAYKMRCLRASDERRAIVEDVLDRVYLLLLAALFQRHLAEHGDWPRRLKCDKSIHQLRHFVSFFKR